MMSFRLAKGTIFCASSRFRVQ